MTAPRNGEGVRGNAATDATLTVDTFVAEVPIDPQRCILVYLREHGGRRYVRWRVFHRHQKHGNVYPDRRRAFVVPVGIADALAHAITSAVAGKAITPKPAWLEKLDEQRGCMLPKLIDLNAPPVYIEREKRRRARGWGLGPATMPPLWRGRGRQ